MACHTPSETTQGPAHRGYAHLQGAHRALDGDYFIACITSKGTQAKQSRRIEIRAEQTVDRSVCSALISYLIEFDSSCDLLHTNPMPLHHVNASDAENFDTLGVTGLTLSSSVNSNLSNQRRLNEASRSSVSNLSDSYDNTTFEGGHQNQTFSVESSQHSASFLQ